MAFHVQRAQLAAWSQDSADTLDSRPGLHFWLVPAGINGRTHRAQVRSMHFPAAPVVAIAAPASPPPRFATDGLPDESFAHKTTAPRPINLALGPHGPATRERGCRPGNQARSFLAPQRLRRRRARRSRPPQARRSHGVMAADGGMAPPTRRARLGDDAPATSSRSADGCGSPDKFRQKPRRVRRRSEGRSVFVAT